MRRSNLPPPDLVIDLEVGQVAVEIAVVEAAQSAGSTNRIRLQSPDQLLPPLLPHPLVVIRVDGVQP